MNWFKSMAERKKDIKARHEEYDKANKAWKVMMEEDIENFNLEAAKKLSNEWKRTNGRKPLTPMNECWFILTGFPRKPGWREE